jgi:hypothetical protein
MKRAAEADIVKAEDDKHEIEERKDSPEVTRDVADLGENIERKLTR